MNYVVFVCLISLRVEPSRSVRQMARFYLLLLSSGPLYGGTTSSFTHRGTLRLLPSLGLLCSGVFYAQLQASVVWKGGFLRQHVIFCPLKFSPDLYDRRHLVCLCLCVLGNPVHSSRAGLGSSCVLGCL